MVTSQTFNYVPTGQSGWRVEFINPAGGTIKDGDSYDLEAEAVCVNGS